MLFSGGGRFGCHMRRLAFAKLHAIAEPAARIKSRVGVSRQGVAPLRTPLQST